MTTMLQSFLAHACMHSCKLSCDRNPVALWHVLQASVCVICAFHLFAKKRVSLALVFNSYTSHQHNISSIFNKLSCRQETCNFTAATGSPRQLAVSGPRLTFCRILVFRESPRLIFSTKTKLGTVFTLTFGWRLHLLVQGEICQSNVLTCLSFLLSVTRHQWGWVDSQFYS